MEFLKLEIGTKKNPIVIDIKEYKGRKLIDIRKFFPSKEDKELILPSKKGISLNPSQFGQLIEELNNNSQKISEFFDPQSISDSNYNLSINIKSTIGRQFHVSFEGGDIKVLLDNSFKKRLSDSQAEIFSKLILGLYLT